MEVIADIDGWKKIINVPEYIARSGFLYVSIQQPISLLVRPTDIIRDEYGITKVLLSNIGNNIFKYQP
jgi:hypothetical protein